MTSVSCLSFSALIPVIHKSTPDQFHSPIPTPSQTRRKRCVCLANKRPSQNSSQPKKRTRSSLQIIQEDASAFTLFLRSIFRKRPSTNDTSVAIPDDEEENLISDEETERKPRSALGNAIAEQYVSVRGALGRIAETITIRATDFSQILFRSGTMISNALKSATPGRWKPLSAFEWQLISPQDSKSIEQRRQQRLQEISKSFQTGAINLAFRAGEGTFATVSSIFRASAFTVSVVGNAFKSVKESPVGIRPVSAATTKNVAAIAAKNSSAQKSPVRKKRRYYHSGEKRQRESTQPLVSTTKAEVSNPGVGVKPGLPKSAPIADKKRFSTTKKTMEPKEGTLNESTEQNEFNEEENLQKADSKQSVSDTNAASKGSMDRRSIPAIALGTGAIVSVASGISLPMFVTGSAVLLTSYVMNQAKRSILDSEIRAKARKVFRQSGAIKGFENMIEDSGMTSKSRMNRIGYRRSLKTNTSEISRPWSGKLVDDSETISVIDTAAQIVSSQQQTIFSTPVVGDVLSLIDSAALVVENLLMSIRRRFGMRKGVRKTADGWVLLDSFHEDLK